MGPLVSDEVNPQAGVTLETRVNGELRQQGSTTDFIFSIPALLTFISGCLRWSGGRDSDRDAIRVGAAEAWGSG